MKVLLTNDDGINAPGLLALCEEISEIADLTVVSTTEERSGASHAITLAHPLRAEPYLVGGRFPGHVLNGTPADCVKYAVQLLVESPPDLVLSGINFGANSGLNIRYSGTVSAATEAVFQGFPALAVSLKDRKPEFQAAARLTRALVPKILERFRGQPVLLNLNVPGGGEVRGVRVVRHSSGRFVDRFHRREDPRGRSYYWLNGDEIIDDPQMDHDDWALSDGYASLTPLRLDWTDYELLQDLQSWTQEGFPHGA